MWIDTTYSELMAIKGALSILNQKIHQTQKCERNIRGLESILEKSRNIGIMTRVFYALYQRLDFIRRIKAIKVDNDKIEKKDVN